uniref:Uncharacterized protein n=1 Tax=Anguilla anguilla TaxID=7936 RepID=A0A0E9T9V7_ANGAN
MCCLKVEDDARCMIDSRPHCSSPAF